MRSFKKKKLNIKKHLEGSKRQTTKKQANPISLSWKTRAKGILFIAQAQAAPFSRVGWGAKKPTEPSVGVL